MSPLRSILLAGAAALCLSQASALYSPSDDVIQLDEKNFEKTGEWCDPVHPLRASCLAEICEC